MYGGSFALIHRKQGGRTMKKGMSLFLGMVFGLSLLAITTAWLPGTAAADDARIIRIYAETYGRFSGRIEPADIWVKPGTVVIWNNWGKVEVSIEFKEGKECDEATESAMGFKFDPDTSCMITNQYIPYGGTASMKFDKPGRYNYKVNFINMTHSESGSVLVRAE